MAVVFYWLIIILLRNNYFDCRAHNHEDNKQLSNIFEAAKSFNSQYKIRSWMIHYDGSTSKHMLRKLLKEKSNNFGYIRFNYLPFKHNISRTSRRTLHLYIGRSFEYLRDLMDKPKHISTGNRVMKSVHPLGHERWLIFAIQDSRTQRSSLRNMLKSLLVRFDSYLFSFYKNDNGGGYEGKFEIFDEYKIDEFSNRIFSTRYGEWDPIHGLKIFEKNIWKRRSNLMGHHFSISSDLWPPLQTLIENGCSSSNCFKGQFPDILYVLQSTMNFTFTVKENPIAGTRLPNGSWTGQIGMVLDKMVDFACGLFVMTRERMNDVDFLILRKSGSGRIYTRNPKDESDWKVYLKPLMKEAWIGILIFSAVIPVLMMLILMERKSGYTNKTVICLLLEAYLAVYKSLICLDSNLKLHAASKRISYFSVVLGGMLLFWLWDAQLINYFTVPLQKLPFNNLEEFLAKSNKKLIVFRGSYDEDRFRYATDPTEQRVWKERIAPYIEEEIYTKSECAVMDHIVKDDSYAAYMTMQESGSFELGCKKWIECEVVVIPHVIHKILGGGWIFPKFSPFLPMFRHYVNKLREGGILDAIIASHSFRRGQDQICPKYDGKPIALEKSFSLFGIMYFGLGASFILLVIECCIAKKQRYHLRNVIRNIIRKRKLKIQEIQE